MLIGAFIAGAVLLVVLLAALRSPGAVPDRQPSWASHAALDGPPPRSWKGQQLGLPPYGPNSLGTIARRFGAMVIDGLLVSPVVAIGVVARHTRFVHRIDPATGTSHLRIVSNHSSVALSLLLIVPAAVYTVALIAVRGQTVGKMAMGLRVARRQDGAVPGWGVSVRRWLLPSAPALLRLGLPTVGAAFTLVSLVDLLWALWDPNRQCLHDKLAETLVVNTP
jgi:uncharacterized RDD family membrane protein YckC